MTGEQIHKHYVAPREKAQTQPIQAHNGKVVGRLDGDTLTKTVHSSRHLLRKPPAWALDVASLDQAKALGARRVALHDADTGATYEAPLDLFDLYAFDLDRGFGRQRALPLERWAKRMVGEPHQEVLW